MTRAPVSPAPRRRDRAAFPQNGFFEAQPKLRLKVEADPASVDIFIDDHGIVRALLY
jgi:hypothetical protein